MPHMGSPSRPGCQTVPVVPYSSKTTQSPKYPSPYSLTLPTALPSWDHLHHLLVFPSLLGTNWKWTLPSSSSGSSPWKPLPALRAVGDLLGLLRKRSPQLCLLALSSWAEWVQPSTSSSFPCFISLLTLDTVVGVLCCPWS